MNWYFKKNGRQLGPVSSMQLKQLAAIGQLLPSDPVRKEESQRWVEARQVKGLPFPPGSATSERSPGPRPSLPVESRPAYPLVPIDPPPEEEEPVIIPPPQDIPRKRPSPAEDRPQKSRSRFSFTNPANQGDYVPPAETPQDLIGRTDTNSFTEGSHNILETSSEELVWQGRPSFLLLVWPALSWGVLALLPLYGDAQLAAQWPRYGGGQLALFSVVVLVLGALIIGLRALKISNTIYKLSSQRLEITTGVLAPTTERYPLIDFSGENKIAYPFPLRFFGLATIAIGRRRGERLVLEGILDVRKIDDLIFTASESGFLGEMATRKRRGF
jgi:hypothetical protein